MNYIFAGLVLAFAAQPNAVSHNERQSRIEYSLGGVDIQDSPWVDFVIQAAGWTGGQHGWIDRN